ncbi:MAG: hypothetical protein IIA44_08110, partial [Acidobacteria bacterium]|nr:hypothetical protein [Acidobacteriota bacterium]
MKFLIELGAGMVGVFLLALGVLRQTSHAIVGTGLTAGTTQTQADGLALTADINEVSTVASTDNTVVLPTATIGRRVTIINNGANTLRIYPGSGDDLGAGADTFLVGGLAAGANITFEAYDATTWEVAHHSSVAQHAESHSLASHSTEAHSELTGVGTADHHGNDAHAGLILSGLVSARPAAATLDRFFWATDENILYHDTGSAWEKAAVADHVDLDGIGTDDHHAKYTDAEAVTQALAQKLDDFTAPDDNTDLNFSTTKHGLVPKGPNTGTFLKDDGTWAAPGGSTPGLVLEGSNNTEATTTSSTESDLVDISGLTIPAGTPIIVMVNIRSTSSGGSGDAKLGLKINATQIWDATIFNDNIFQTLDGMAIFFIAPRVTNFVRGGILLMHDDQQPPPTVHSQDDDAPIAEVTNIIITGKIDNSDTLGVD